VGDASYLKRVKFDFEKVKNEKSNVEMIIKNLHKLLEYESKIQ